jgi:hypothetical protein
MTNIPKVSFQDTEKVREIGKDIDAQGIHSYSAVHNSIRYLLGYSWTFIKDGQKRAEYVLSKCTQNLWWTPDRIKLLWEDIVGACRYRRYTQWVPREAFSSEPPDPHIWNKNFRTRTNSINTIEKQKKTVRKNNEEPISVKALVEASKAAYDAGLKAAKLRLQSNPFAGALDNIPGYNST